MNIPFYTDEQIKKSKNQYTFHQKVGVFLFLCGIIVLFLQGGVSNIAIIVGSVLCWIGLIGTIFFTVSKIELLSETTNEKLNEIKTFAKIYPEVENHRLKLIEHNRKLTNNDYINIKNAISQLATSDFYEPPTPQINIVDIQKIQSKKTTSPYSE